VNIGRFVSELLEEPLTYAEATSNTRWQIAMDREIQSIQKNKTWEIVNRTPDMQSITAKWIYKLKKTPTGEERPKTRIVAWGFQQKDGKDYNKLFAPIIRWSMIQLIFALAVKYRWLLHHMDVITAFLNGIIEGNIFMEIPDEFLEVGNPMKVCKVKRALYGLP